MLSWIIDRERTGVDTYAYNLIENMIKIGKSKDLYLIHYHKANDQIYQKDHEVIVPKIPFKLTNILGLPYAINKINMDVLHIPAHWHTQILPFFLNIKVKKVLTIHDLTPILFPETHTKQTVLLWNSTLKLIKNKIDIIIADSQNTKSDCMRLLKVHEEKIKVIYLAADKIYKPLDDKRGKIMEELRRTYNINSNFILYVGTLEKRKNIPNLIKAFYKLKKRGINPKLVVVGKKGWKYNEIFETMENLNLQKDIIFTGYVPKEDLVKFYNLADVFIYPSLYEGFGLPPLESVACGTPVIASNTSSLPEVVGDAGIMVNPYDVDELVDKMYEVLTNDGLRDELSKKGLERAKLFSWEKTAKETWNVYEVMYHGK